MSIENLKGEIFSVDGKVGIAVPPAGMEDAIPFEVLEIHPPVGPSPAWADILLAGKPVRINPDICQPPFFRLADCLMVAHFQREELPLHTMAAKVTLPPAPHPNAQDYLFWRENISGREVVMIDTLERVEQHTITAQDGQSRHRGGWGRRFKK
jgi:hypothetical protein